MNQGTLNNLAPGRRPFGVPPKLTNVPHIYKHHILEGIISNLNKYGKKRVELVETTTVQQTKIMVGVNIIISHL